MCVTCDKRVTRGTLLRFQIILKGGLTFNDTRM